MWRIGDDFQQSRSTVALDVRMKASGRMWTAAIAAEASVSSGLSLALYGALDLVIPILLQGV